MNIQQAIDILERHNKWRRGDGYEMVEPAEIGIAIDTIVEHLKKKNQFHGCDECCFCAMPRHFEDIPVCSNKESPMYDQFVDEDLTCKYFEPKQ
jgi:hypothetical protein